MQHLRLFRYLVIALILWYPTLASAAAPDIKADKQYYDFATGFYIFEGNVSVQIKNSLIQAQRARVSLNTLEVFADGGITLIQDGMCFRGDTVYVIGNERRVIIEGDIRMESGGITITCTKADFNWKTKNAILSDASFVEDGVLKRVNEAVYNVREKTLQY